MPSPLMPLGAAVTLAAIALVSAAAADPPESFEFRFWPGRAAKNDPRFVSLHDGPCGDTVAARVRSMPADSPNAVFLAEPVFERSATGAFQKRWRIPVDSVPNGVRGRSILFRAGHKQYAVTTQGTIRLIPGKPIDQPYKPVACRPPRQLADTAYFACQEFEDQATKKPRVLGFESPCT
jgi:hypothetical protein